VGAVLAAVAVVLTHAGVTTVTTPVPQAEGVPTVPSPGGAAFYVLMLGLAGQISSAKDLATLREMRQNERYTTPEDPSGATLTHVDANGVPADWICAPGASTDRAVLYLHGGGFVMPVSNGHRQFSATLSRELDACVLLPNYRVAPENPFPAPVDDTVHAYQYLRQRGVAAKRIVVLGDSCGGTFALAAALRLRDAGEAMFGLALLLGIYLQTRRAYLRELEERARRLEKEREQQDRLAVAAERARIAREVHDIVAHNLAVMVALADGAAAVTPTEPERGVDMM
jgi:acetyl esterase/lipase